MPRKVKILYFTVNRRNWLHEQSEYFKSLLVKHPDVDVHFVEDGGDIKELLARLDLTPDFIYIDHNLPRMKPITGLNNIPVPKGVLVDVLHHKTRRFRTLMNDKCIDVIFGFYRDAFARYFPEYVNRFIWLPRHVNPRIFKDYGLKKDIDYLLMGRVNKDVYPFRHKMVRKMKSIKGFVYHEHPGYRYFSNREKGEVFIGKKYAQEINRAKIFLTDGSLYKYPVSKYFEVPACNTLLLATGSQELKDLGFIDGETFVQIDKHNFLKKAKYYLKHEDERNDISRRGYEMVRARHTTEIRVNEFVQHVKTFLGM
ncbi:spore maturation protein CgeB [Caldalkalibacillus uzonensis]|uniref:Spore maturation protein CgeB n=1 Tax=Caldalkalibacillus uzonensis TaxID=353224 RepID=A0ABU0CRF4_9BACI|nr:glycosyltransferase [Caldalkalibacillus uzonensis]MDQ0339006.1 spore maturation protein CgeB [Caldalkalibacillus uzonensis]